LLSFSYQKFEKTNAEHEELGGKFTENKHTQNIHSQNFSIKIVDEFMAADGFAHTCTFRI